MGAVKTLFAVAALLIMNGAGASVFETRCEASASSKPVLLSTGDDGYRIDNSLPARALTRMKGRSARYAYVLGLTRTESRLSMGVDGKMLVDTDSGRECLAPQIAVSLSYIPIVIYVGSEFAPGSCAYQAILAHEMRHLKTYLDYLPKVETRVRAALTKRFDGQILYAPVGQVKQQLEAEIDTAWMPYLKSEMAKVEALQTAIDSPKEYARLSKVCKGEVQSLIGAAKRKR